jgi:hypothetical protein
MHPIFVKILCIYTRRGVWASRFFCMNSFREEREERGNKEVLASSRAVCNQGQALKRLDETEYCISPVL